MKTELLSRFVLLFLISFILTKPLSLETLDYLRADQQIFDEFHHRLRMLGCKSGAYSKIKSLYDSEEIDSYLNQTRYKRSFLNALESDLRVRCEKVTDDDKLVFNETIYQNYDDNQKFEQFFKGFNITEVLQRVNLDKEKVEAKEEL
jgi:hypothetical protein